MARTFDGTGDTLTVGIGALSGVTGSDGSTFAVLCRRASDGLSASDTVLAISSGNTRRVSIGFAQTFFGADQLLIQVASTLVTGGTGTEVVAADGYVLVAVTKAGGSATPRMHIYNYGANTWVHDPGSSSAGNWTAGAEIRIGAEDGTEGEGFNGDIAAAAIWTRALSDAEIENLAFSLAHWHSQAPAALWVLDQSDTGQTVPDLTGGGANQSALVGTAVATTSVPVWSYGASPLVVAGAAAVVDATVDAETGTATATGQAATPQATVPGAAGDATAAGQAASVRTDATITGTAGSAAAAGQTATITATVPGDAGSATAAGQSAALTVTSALPGEAGLATATGQAASLVISSTVSAEASTATASGHAAAAGSVATIAAEAGNATAAGQAASIVVSSTVAGEAGSATATGQMATPQAAVPGAAGSATAPGQTALLTALMVAVVGAATAGGQAASLTVSSTVTAATGTATAGGEAATVTTVIPLTGQRLGPGGPVARMIGSGIGSGRATRETAPAGGSASRRGPPDGGTA